MKEKYNFWKKTFPIMFFLLGFGAYQMHAQETTTGHIDDDLGVPLAGVTVILKGTTNGVTTDFDGNFSISASEGDVLSFSYLGFKPQEVTVGPTRRIDLQMQLDTQNLDEVVIVGYGTLEKKELTGSQVSLKSDDINKVQAISFEEALQGKAAGVLITTSQGGPGDAAIIQIRGATSINASSAPLYVIDGVEIDGDVVGTGGAAETGRAAASSPLSLIDPNNIASIDVLKDANATSIYGSRGANGVVIITTKTGKGSDNKITLDLDVSTGVQNIANQIDILGAQEYVDFIREAFPWDPSRSATRFQQLAFRDNNGNALPVNDIRADGNPRFGIRDFRDEIFRAALLNKYSLGVRSGNNNSWFGANVSYTDQEGIVANTDYQRIQASVNVGGNITPRLQVGVQASGGRSGRSGIVSAAPDAGGRGGFGVITNLALAAPVQGRFDTSRNGNGANNIVRDETGFVTEVDGRFIINPVTQVNETVSTSEELFGFISAYLEYKLTDDLKFRSSVSFNSYGNQGEVYLPSTFGFGRIQGGIANISVFNTARWQNNNTLTFDKLFAEKHKLNVVVGTSVLSSESKSRVLRATEFQSDLVNLDDIGSGTNINISSGREENGLLGIFGRINYSFNNRYVLNVTARTDKSSRFFPGATQWGFFPSAGVTWNASEESFLKDVGFLSNLRFKGSVGQSGNDKIGVFQSQLSFNSTRFIDFRNGSGINAAAVRNGSRNNGFFLSRVSNPELTWETTTQYDLGAEIGLFKNRINLAVDLFRKDTKDLLLQRPTASQSGFAFILENVGEVQNKGAEVSFRSTNINTKNFTWTTDFNISYIENEVISLGGVQEEFTVTADAGRSVGNDFIVREGSPLGSIFGFVSDGVYQFSDFVEFDGLSEAEAIALYRTDPATGRLRAGAGDDNSNAFTLKDGVPQNGAAGTNRPGQQKLADLNGDLIVDENDLTIIGDANPDHFGGLTNSFTYKAWDLSIAMNWKYGGDIYNKNNFPGFNVTSFANKYGVARDRWTPNNQDTNVHSLRGRTRSEGFANVSDFIEDGSFLRLQNISVGFNFPSDVTKRLGLGQLRFYGAADNVYVWTNYSGYDPDVSVAGGVNSGLTPGVDFDAYPKAITFRFGIKATF